MAEHPIQQAPPSRKIWRIWQFLADVRKEYLWNYALAKYYLGFRYPREGEIRREYKQYLTDKHVALVGPAPSVEGSRQGEFIDSHDVVVRLNHALPLSEPLRPDIGSRTDVLYHHLWPEHPTRPPGPEFMQLVLAAPCQWICSANPYANVRIRFKDWIDRFDALRGDRVRFYVPDMREAYGIRRRARTWPNTGVFAILHLLSFPVARLHITGFTFYSGKKTYQEGYQGLGALPIHDQERQRACVARAIQTDSRVSLDQELARVLLLPVTGTTRPKGA
jgi:hypothetical protein